MKMMISIIFLVICGAMNVLGYDEIIETTELPDPKEIPTLSNGHIGFVIFGSSILMNGLYNGKKGESRRARIPNFSNIETDIICTETNCNYQLNMLQGIFKATFSSGDDYKVEQHIYAHRFYNRAIISKLHLTRQAVTGEVIVKLLVNPGDVPGVDLTQVGSDKTETISGKNITIRCFQTNVVENEVYQPLKSEVCVAHTDPPQTLHLAVGELLTEYLHVTTIARTEAEVRKEIEDVINNEATLHQSHQNEWEKSWNKLEIAVEGNSKLNQIIHASIFYLISNLPSEETNQDKDPFYGLSPSGIGRGSILYEAYQGHSFWDTEMWMHPPILLLNPQWSEDLLKYRYNVRQAAADNAKNTGYKGYRFPWESGFTGAEVTPDCCPHVVEYQHHIISDIAFAFRSHLAATHDIELFKTIGCDIAWNTAKFWESRVRFNETTDFYDIRGVMGPDEDHPNIDNNVYTNVNAAINLYFGDFAGCACKDVLKVSESEYENFAKIARSLVLLYDETAKYHPQFENYNRTIEIKQADAILLGYPLQLPMDSEVKKNDLLFYDAVTRENGPAMTWAMHTIGFLDLHDEVEAAKVLERSYSLYTREPFKVWSEAIPNVKAAGNFITGAGGFLQSILNGYGGVRLHFNHLTITNFYVPPESTSLMFNGISYLNNRFTLKISGDQAVVKFIKLDNDHPLKITLKLTNIVFNPTLGSEIRFNRTDELVMEATKNPFETCPMKETVLGQKAGAAAVKICVILTAVLGLIIMKL